MFGSPASLLAMVADLRLVIQCLEALLPCWPGFLIYSKSCDLVLAALLPFWPGFPAINKMVICWQPCSPVGQGAELSNVIRCLAALLPCWPGLLI